MMSRHSLLRKVEGAPTSQVVRLSGWMDFDKWTAVYQAETRTIFSDSDESI